MTPTAEQYFKNLGINVEFNTIGCTKELISAYIANTQDLVAAEAIGASENLKALCYSRFYSMPAREKLTGFESFNKIDFNFRIDINNSLLPQVRPCEIFDKTENSTAFKSTVISHLATYTKPIVLYLSGGLDSELVANALLEANIPFVPVIFKWSDNNGVVQNDNETVHAYTFCAAHALSPVTEIVNIEALWATQEFRALATSLQIASPQLTTHAHMVNVINTRLPNHQHLFGGEVRYRTNYLREDENSIPANLVLMQKVAPGYNGMYMLVGLADEMDINFLSSVSLHFEANGQWYITFDGRTPTSYSPTGPLSGTFAVAPLSQSGYQWRVSAISVGAMNGGYISPAGPTGWQTLSGNTVTVGAYHDGSDVNTLGDAVFYIEIRVTAYPAQVMYSNIRLAYSQYVQGGG
jgi:hypothetical protein